MVKAVIGIIERNKMLLMSQRSLHQSYSGYWEFPGGKIEENESYFAALKRELREELGINVTEAVLFLQHTHAYPDYQVNLMVYRVTHFLHEPVSQEGQVLRWVSLADLEQLTLLAGSQFIVEKLRTVS